LRPFLSNNPASCASQSGSFAGRAGYETTVRFGTSAENVCPGTNRQRNKKRQKRGVESLKELVRGPSPPNIFNGGPVGVAAGFPLKACGNDKNSEVWTCI